MLHAVAVLFAECVDRVDRSIFQVTEQELNQLDRLVDPQFGTYFGANWHYFGANWHSFGAPYSR